MCWKQHKRVSMSNVFLQMHCFNSYSELEEPEFLYPPAAFFDVKKMWPYWKTWRPLIATVLTLNIEREMNLCLTCFAFVCSGLGDSRPWQRHVYVCHPQASNKSGCLGINFVHLVMDGTCKENTPPHSGAYANAVSLVRVNKPHPLSISWPPNRQRNEPLCTISWLAGKLSWDLTK